MVESHTLFTISKEGLNPPYSDKVDIKVFMLSDDIVIYKVKTFSEIREK